MNSEFGERIKFLRLQRGMTQANLATVLGVTKTMISAYETGTRKPSNDNLMEIALFFDVSMDWLFGHTEDRNGTPAMDISQLSRQQRMIVQEIVSEFKRQNKLEKFYLGNNRPGT